MLILNIWVTFLCHAYNEIKDKFDERSTKCIFLGYPYGQKRWRIYDMKQKQIFMSRDVVFYENIFPYDKMVSPLVNPINKRSGLVITKLWTNEVCIVFQRICIQSLIFVTRWTNLKSSYSISIFKSWFWTWESRSSLEIFKYPSSLWNRKSWSSRLFFLREREI